MGALKISDELTGLLHRGRSYKISKGQMLLTTYELKILHLIKSGYVKRYLIANDGSIGIQIIYGPGDIFPLTLVFKQLLGQDLYEGPEVYYYETMTEAEIYRIEGEELKKHIEHNPMLYKELMSLTGKRLHSTLYGLENVTLASTYNKVAHQLTYFAHRFGQIRSNGIKIMLPLTRQDLADILSVRRETVSIAMIELKKKGLIKGGRNITIPNIKKLEEEAYK